MPTPCRFLVLVMAVAIAPSARADEAAAPTPAPTQTSPSASTTAPTPAAQPVAAPAQAVAATPAPAPIDAKPDAKTEVVPRPKKGLVIGLGAGAVVALVTGAVLGGIAKSRSDEQNGNVSAPPVYTPALVDSGHQGTSIAAGAYVCLAIGGALAIADIALLIERFRKPAKKTDAHAGVGVVADGLQVSF